MPITINYIIRLQSQEGNVTHFINFVYERCKRKYITIIYYYFVILLGSCRVVEFVENENIWFSFTLTSLMFSLNFPQIFSGTLAAPILNGGNCILGRET